MKPHRILAINRCVNHKRSFSISIDTPVDGSGVRLTPTKCCGQWRRMEEWPVDAGRLASIIADLEAELSALLEGKP